MEKRVIKPDVRKILLRAAADFPPDVTILLSGGVDSAAVLFSALECGKRPRAVTFGFQDAPGEDVRFARDVAARFGVPWKPCWLPRDPAVLRADALQFARWGARVKTDVTCSWPIHRVLRDAEGDFLAGGIGADGYFCISKKGMMHWRNRMDEWRHHLYVEMGDRYCQRVITNRSAAEVSKTLSWPFLRPDMLREFRGAEWDQINRPRQKEPVVAAFPDHFKKIKIRKHLNFQKGDSGIDEHVTECIRVSEYLSNPGARMIDLPVRLVARWMGARGWSAEDARTVLTAAGAANHASKLRSWMAEGASDPDSAIPLTDADESALGDLLRSGRPRSASPLPTRRLSFLE